MFTDTCCLDPDVEDEEEDEEVDEDEDAEEEEEEGGGVVDELVFSDGCLILKCILSAPSVPYAL